MEEKAPCNVRNVCRSSGNLCLSFVLTGGGGEGN